MRGLILIYLCEIGDKIQQCSNPAHVRDHIYQATRVICLNTDHPHLKDAQVELLYQEAAETLMPPLKKFFSKMTIPAGEDWSVLWTNKKMFHSKAFYNVLITQWRHDYERLCVFLHEY